MLFSLLVLSCSTDKTSLPQAPPAKLRLLTRREYTNTVNDLFFPDTNNACATDFDCAIDSESCLSGSCIQDRCSTHTFVWNGSGDETVYVIGSFNDWATDETQGAWKLSAHSNGMHVLKADLSSDEHEYLFLVNGVETQDPQNPNTSDDGNSLLFTQCTPNGLYENDPAIDFPVESRPEGFAFNNAAEKGNVTTTHIDKYIEAAYHISSTVHVDALVSCSLSDTACTDDWLQDFGEKIFRRPLRNDETTHYQNIRDQSSSAEQGIRDVLLTMLISPHFLYKKEIGSAGESGKNELDGHEIATSMSYFLWGSTPDAELLEAAQNGNLTSSAAREEPLINDSLTPLIY